MATGLQLICPPQKTPYPQPGQPELFNKTWWLFFSAIANFLGRPLVRTGLRADRLALDPASVLPATLFTETDTGLIYQMIVVDGKASWFYVSGVYSLAQAGIPAFVSGLGLGDAGLLIGSSDYFHTYRWDGAALGFAPGDEGSGSIVAGLPNGGLWAPCDGGLYGFAQPSGIVIASNTPNLTNDVFIMGSGAISLLQPETRAAWEPGAKTDDESAHTHSVSVLNSGNFDSLEADFPAVTEQTVSTGPGSAHSHTLSDANARLKKPSGGGLPNRIGLTWFQRR